MNRDGGAAHPVFSGNETLGIGWIGRRIDMSYRTVIAASLAAIFISLPLAAEVVKVADARKDKTVEGFYVLFVSQRTHESGALGSAIIAAGKGESPETIKIECAWGMYTEGRMPRAGSVSAERIEALRSSSGDYETKTFIARVDEEQYAAAAGHIGQWMEGEVLSPIMPAGMVLEAMNIMLNEIGELKMPYRNSSSLDAQLYFEDLHVLNRKK